MGRITAARRKALPKSDFALPGKRSKSKGEGGYPIDTAGRARSALSRVDANGTPAEKKTVRAAVHRKYPGMKITKHPKGHK
ncbi:MAG: hypothetical protein AAGL98_00245 [Planctomycetota bacterium]